MGPVNGILFNGILTMPFYRSSPIDFHYEVHGHGRPLIFSHGLGGNVERVKEFVLDLPDTRTIIYDNRAHGRTTPLGDPAYLNFARMADDMAGLLDHLAIDRTVIGGVSMGAGIALSCALRHPDRVLGLVLSRPAWLDSPHPPNLAFTSIVAGLIEQHGLPNAGRLFEQTDYYKQLLSTSPGTADSLRSVLLEANADTLVAAYRNISASAPVDSLDRLSLIGVPALVIGNHNDPIHPFSVAETLARALPNARLEEIVSRFDDATVHVQEFRAALINYLRELPQ